MKSNAIFAHVEEEFGIFEWKTISFSSCERLAQNIWFLKLQTMTTFMSPPPAATFLAFHPQDNNIIAIGMDDSTIQIYNVRVDEVNMTKTLVPPSAVHNLDSLDIYSSWKFCFRLKASLEVTLKELLALPSLKS